MKTGLRITPEVSPAELEEIAANTGVGIDMPGGRAGWAFVTTPNGRRYKAWLSTPRAEEA